MAIGGLLLTIGGFFAIANEASVAALRARESVRRSIDLTAGAFAEELKLLAGRFQSIRPGDSAAVENFKQQNPDVGFVILLKDEPEIDGGARKTDIKIPVEVETCLDEAAWREFVKGDYNSARNALMRASDNAHELPAQAAAGLARAGFEMRRGNSAEALAVLEELILQLNNDGDLLNPVSNAPALPVALLLKSRILAGSDRDAATRTARGLIAQLQQKPAPGAMGILREIEELAVIPQDEMAAPREKLQKEREALYLTKMIHERGAEWLAGEAGMRPLDGRIAFAGAREADGRLIGVLDGEQFIQKNTARATSLARAAGVNVDGAARPGVLAEEVPVPGSLGVLRAGLRENIPFREYKYSTLMYVLAALVVLLGFSIAGGAWFLARATAREIEAAQAKSEFLAGITHELKTPLASIRLYGEMLEEGAELNLQKRSEYIKTIGREADRLTQLIDRVLALARLEQAAPGEALSTTTALEILQNAADAFSPLAKQHSLQFALDARDGATRVSCDPAAMVQSLVDLLDNARKYAASGGVVELAGRRENNNYVFAVEDRGPGLPPGDPELLFRMFARGEGDSVRGKSGLGIGLALARRIVEANRGTIAARNRKGGGASFEIRLPVAEDGV